MEEVNKLGKILIVDDNEDVLFALNLLLEPYTEKIKVATTPDRIEHFMTTFHPDLILLDMNFSLYDHQHFLSHILSIHSPLPY